MFFKRLHHTFLFFLTLIVVGCTTSSTVPTFESEDSTPSASVTKQQNDPTVKLNLQNNTNIAVLLPLSGNSKAVGNAILNGIILSLSNTDKADKIVLQIYDTKGDPLLAKSFAEKALSKNVDAIIGPLTSDETVAVAKVLNGKEIPMLSFTNDTNSITGYKNAYLLSLTPEMDMERMVNYIVKNDTTKTRFAIIAPDNKYGSASIIALDNAIANQGGVLVRAISYNYDRSGIMSDIEKLMSPELLKDYKEKINIQSQELRNNPNKKLTPEEIVPLPELDFDVLVIADLGQNLFFTSSFIQASSLNYDKLLIVGNSFWYGARNLESNPVLKKSFFPYVSVSNYDLFEKEYTEKFNSNATIFSVMGYDALSTLVNNIKVIDKKINVDFSDKSFDKSKIYVGAVGTYFFRDDRIIQREMEVISKDKSVIIDDSLMLDYSYGTNYNGKRGNAKDIIDNVNSEGYFKYNLNTVDVKSVD